MDATLTFTVNGQSRTVTTDPARPLLDVLREDLGLTGTKYGCGESQCGACTVVINGEAVRSCRVPLKSVAGKEVLTIEGLARGKALHPLQKALIRHGAIQCGFCTPGMILNAYSLLNRKPVPGPAEIREGMEGNLCRCGCYGRILEAIASAAEEMKTGRTR